MPDPFVPKLSRETVERIAREQAGLSLPEASLDDLTKLVNALLEDSAPAFAAAARAGAEPDIAFTLEEWSHD